MFSIIIYALFIYIVGSIPNALWIGKKFRNLDIRTKGSGNLGATNATRYLGKKLGAMVLVLDILKGLIPIFLAKNYLIPKLWSNYNDKLLLSIFIFLAILAHSYSVFLKFTGGKSVAIMVGIYLIVFPKAMFLALIVFVLTIIFIKYVALASIFMASSMILFVPVIYGGFYYFVLTVLVAMLITYRHKSNLLRLLNGTETKGI